SLCPARARALRVTPSRRAPERSGSSGHRSSPGLTNEASRRQRWSGRMTARRVATRFAGDTDTIFPSTTGTPIEPHHWRQRIFNPARQAAGLNWATPHKLRHGLASLMADAGCAAAEIAAHLGHADRGVTALRWYITQALHEAPAAADALL